MFHSVCNESIWVSLSDTRDKNIQLNWHRMSSSVSSGVFRYIHSRYEGLLLIQRLNTSNCCYVLAQEEWMLQVNDRSEFDSFFNFWHVLPPAYSAVIINLLQRVWIPPSAPLHYSYLFTTELFFLPEILLWCCVWLGPTSDGFLIVIFTRFSFSPTTRWLGPHISSSLRMSQWEQSPRKWHTS